MDAGLRIIAPIENPRLIWAVVGTITRTDTAVINLQIQIFRRAVYRGEHRANGFTGRVVALLAHYGLIGRHLHGRESTLPKTFNANPLQGAAITGIHFADERDVIFHGASRHTGLTAGTNILVDGHAPDIRSHNFGLLRYGCLRF